MNNFEDWHQRQATTRTPVLPTWTWQASHPQQTTSHKKREKNLTDDGKSVKHWMLTERKK